MKKVFIVNEALNFSDIQDIKKLRARAESCQRVALASRQAAEKAAAESHAKLASDLLAQADELEEVAQNIFSKIKDNPQPDVEKPQAQNSANTSADNDPNNLDDLDSSEENDNSEESDNMSASEETDKTDSSTESTSSDSTDLDTSKDPEETVLSDLSDKITDANSAENTGNIDDSNDSDSKASLDDLDNLSKLDNSENDNDSEDDDNDSDNDSKDVNDSEDDNENFDEDEEDSEDTNKSNESDDIDNSDDLEDSKDDSENSDETTGTEEASETDEVTDGSVSSDDSSETTDSDESDGSSEEADESESSDKTEQTEETEEDDTPAEDPFADEEDIPQLQNPAQTGNPVRTATIKDIIKELQNLPQAARQGAIDALQNMLSKRQPLTEAKALSDMDDDEFGDFINAKLALIDQADQLDYSNDLGDRIAKINQLASNKLANQALADEDNVELKKDFQQTKAKENSGAAFKNYHSVRDFYIDFYDSIKNQVDEVEYMDQSYDEINTDYANTNLIVKADVTRTSQDEAKPIIDLYFDASGSWTGDSKAIEIGKQTVATMQEFVDRDEIVLNVLYFSNANWDGFAHSLSDSRLGRGTRSWEAILKNIKATNAKNVVLMTDCDMDTQAADLNQTCRVEGNVWFIWKLNDVGETGSSNIAKHLIGDAGTYQYSFNI